MPAARVSRSAEERHNERSRRARPTIHDAHVSPEQEVVRAVRTSGVYASHVDTLARKVSRQATFSCECGRDSALTPKPRFAPSGDPQQVTEEGASCPAIHDEVSAKRIERHPNRTTPQYASRRMSRRASGRIHVATTGQGSPFRRDSRRPGRYRLLGSVETQSHAAMNERHASNARYSSHNAFRRVTRHWGRRSDTDRVIGQMGSRDRADGIAR